MGVGGQSIISHHNHVSFKEKEHLVFQPDLTSVERGKCFLYFFFLVAMIVFPIKQLKEDGISSCVYYGDKVRNTLKLPAAAAAAAKSLQSCPTLCDPIDGSPPDSPVPGILQARTLEWVAISFSNA